MRGLRDNPLARYLPLMHQRAERASHRNLPLRIALTLAALTALGYYMHHGLRGSGINATAQGIILAAVLILPACAVLYFRGLFVAFQACLLALNRQPGAQRAGLVEELAGGAHLTAREILCGLGRVILPVLFKRAVAGAVLLLLFQPLAAALNCGVLRFSPVYFQAQSTAEAARLHASKLELWQHGLRESALAAPAVLAVVITSGLLASLLCFLWLTAMGRRAMSRPSIAVEAAALALLQMGGSLFSLVLFTVHAFPGNDPLADIFALDYLPAAAVIMATLSAGLAGLSYLALTARWLRNILPVCLPLAAGALAFSLVNANTLLPSGLSGWARVAASALHWLGALCMCNPLAAPVYSTAGLDALTRAGQDWSGLRWTAWPLALIAFQLILLPWVAHCALASVRRFARGE